LSGRVDAEPSPKRSATRRAEEAGGPHGESHRHRRSSRHGGRWNVPLGKTARRTGMAAGATGDMTPYLSQDDATNVLFPRRGDAARATACPPACQRMAGEGRATGREGTMASCPVNAQGWRWGSAGDVASPPRSGRAALMGGRSPPWPRRTTAREHLPRHLHRPPRLGRRVPDARPAVGHRRVQRPTPLGARTPTGARAAQPPRSTCTRNDRRALRPATRPGSGPPLAPSDRPPFRAHRQRAGQSVGRDNGFRSRHRVERA